MDSGSGNYYPWKVNNNFVIFHLIKNLFTKLISIYQTNGGGKKFFFVECKFNPSCSEYTKQAIHMHGVLKGIILGHRRIKRCDSECVYELIYDPIPGEAILLKNLFLNNEQIEREEEDIRMILRNLSESDRKIFFDTFNQTCKDPDTYAALNFVFLGIHHFYLKKTFTFIMIFILEITSLVSFFSGYFLIGIFSGIFVFTHEIYHLFLSGQIVRQYNNQQSRNIIQNLLIKYN